MIVFDLKCSADHQFEAWFQSSSAYEEQLAMGVVECPVCGDIDVAKAPMAPNVTSKGNSRPDASGVAARSGDPKLELLAAEAEKAIENLRSHVEENCDYVGDSFADEARKIHYGESEERGIYGETTATESKDLIDEGIDVLPLPTPRRGDA